MIKNIIFQISFSRKREITEIGLLEIIKKRM